MSLTTYRQETCVKLAQDVMEINANIHLASHDKAAPRKIERALVV